MSRRRLIALIATMVWLAGGAPVADSSTRRQEAVSTFTCGVMYWANAQSVLSKDWYVVFAGTVIETHRERIPVLGRDRIVRGTLRVRHVWAHYPSRNEDAPPDFAYFKSDGFNGLKKGDKVIVFVNEYDGGYGIIEAQGTGCPLGIKLKRWDEAILKAVQILAENEQTAKRPEERRTILADPEIGAVWKRIDPQGFEAVTRERR